MADDDIRQTFHRQAGGITELRCRHLEQCRLLVHHVGEGVLAAGDVLGHRDAGIVTGLDDDAFQQILQRHRGAFPHEHP